MPGAVPAVAMQGPPHIQDLHQGHSPASPPERLVHIFHQETSLPPLLPAHLLGREEATLYNPCHPNEETEAQRSSSFQQGRVEVAAVQSRPVLKQHPPLYSSFVKTG